MTIVPIRIEPWSTQLEVPAGSPLLPILAAQGVEFPCGGSGICGGCRVRVLSGNLPITPEDEAVFSPNELQSGWRLACQARAETPLILECGHSHIDVLSDSAPIPASGRSGHGIAIDLGTTTIAAQLVDLATGDILAVRTALNTQVQFGSDIMSRIGAAVSGPHHSGSDLTTPIRAQLGALVAELAAVHPGPIREVVIVGNTVMHHLFSGLSVEPLSHAPFQSPHLDEQYFTPSDLAWQLPATCVIRFAPCIGGFVGSDILAGILATGIATAHHLTALVDLGTNGEIVLGNRNGIVCASTAAGPAFEAGTIRMGMRAAPGAIAHVAPSPIAHVAPSAIAHVAPSPIAHVAPSAIAHVAPSPIAHIAHGLQITTIGDCPPRGICGSGLVDAVALALESGAILPNGRIAAAGRTIPLAGPVMLYQSDIRELQLAKAAIASGLMLLLDTLHAPIDELQTLHLAGAFGNYLHVASAIAIGLFACPAARIHPAGNTALRGARMMLLSGDTPSTTSIRHVALAALPHFQERFENSIHFPSTASAL